MIDLLNSIGEVTADSEPVIASARSQYDALPDSTKANVTNYDVLVAAEAALAQIKAAVFFRTDSADAVVKYPVSSRLSLSNIISHEAKRNCRNKHIML